MGTQIFLKSVRIKFDIKSIYLNTRCHIPDTERSSASLFILLEYKAEYKFLSHISHCHSKSGFLLTYKTHNAELGILGKVFEQEGFKYRKLT